ncbi:YidC/Oxa1 family membrane protein insertase, partial [Streptococcus pneumoniae]
KVYGGQNELVRFHVEGLLSLPGLFSPNIWGQLSLGLLWLMEVAFRYTGSWGLAILFLTLVVRLLLWPLMHQQFKSMAEIQRLQP